MSKRGRVFASVALVVALLAPFAGVAARLVPAASSVVGWTSGRGDAGDTGSTSAGPAAGGVAGLAADWSAPGTSTDAVTNPAGSLVFTGCGSSLCAYHVDTGRLRWAVPGAFGTVAATHTTVYAYVRDGAVQRLAALDAQTGNRLWSEPLPATNDDDYADLDSGIVLAGGVAYARIDGTVVADNATDGRRLWSYGGASGEELSGSATPAVARATVYVPAADGLVALSARTGRLEWIGGGLAGNGTAAVSGSTVVVGTDGGLAAFHSGGCGSMQCRPIWSDRLGSGIPTITGGLVYDGTSDDLVSPSTGTTRVVDLATGSPVWMAPQLEGAQAATVADGIVYDADGNGTVHAYPAAGCGASVCRAEMVRRSRRVLGVLRRGPCLGRGRRPYPARRGFRRPLRLHRNGQRDHGPTGGPPDHLDDRGVRAGGRLLVVAPQYRTTDPRLRLHRRCRLPSGRQLRPPHRPREHHQRPVQRAHVPIPAWRQSTQTGVGPGHRGQRRRQRGYPCDL